MATIDYFQKTKDFQSFSAGQVIFTEREPGDVMYVVTEGEVDVLVRDKVIVTAGPGDIVGEMALIDARGRSATVVAKTDCKVVPVDEKRFLFLIQQTPYLCDPGDACISRPFAPHERAHIVITPDLTNTGSECQSTGNSLPFPPCMIGAGDSQAEGPLNRWQPAVILAKTGVLQGYSVSFSPSVID